ncbi:hypothetical protein QCE47_13445, partial [Caballeronia sp. LZ025]|uniref:hypothetical protein n=1 Tax=Caballeronia sp. LZ025 TaxID=3038562 RepID=UPI002862B773
PAFLDPLFRHPRLTVSKKSKQPFRALFELAFKGLARWPGGESAERRKHRLFEERAIQIGLT